MSAEPKLEALIARLHQATHYRVLEVFGSHRYFVVDLEDDVGAGPDQTGILRSTGRQALSQSELTQEVERLLGVR